MWGSYGFYCSSNDKNARNTFESSFRSAVVAEEESPVAAIGVVVRAEPRGFEAEENAKPVEFQISHPPWQVSQRSRRTRYCQADWR
jgi:hypothetical protein